MTGAAPYATRTADCPEIDGPNFFQNHRDPGGVVRLGDKVPDKVVIAGRFTFDPVGAEWLTLALPPVIHIPAAAPSAPPLRAALELFVAEPDPLRSVGTLQSTAWRIFCWSKRSAPT